MPASRASGDSLLTNLLSRLDDGKSAESSGTLHRTLCCHKIRKQRYGGRQRRDTIAYEVSIEQRPVSSIAADVFGHCEDDLIAVALKD